MYKKYDTSSGKRRVGILIKYALIMKLGFILLLAGMFPSLATTLGQTVTFSQKGVNVREILKEVQRQTGYNIFYKTDAISSHRRINIDLRNQPLTSALDEILAGEEVRYTINNKDVIISRGNNGGARPEGVHETQQQEEVSGTVRNVDGEPLAGVSVSNLTSDNRTMTDENGAFRLSADQLPTTLVFTYIGYQRLEISTNEFPLSVQLRPSLTELNEVVVVGYGTQRRSDLTGSVASINSEMLERAPVGQVVNSLQGLASGLEVVSAGGSPADEPNIQIRGTGSINSSNPLVVVDGVPSGSLSDINPNDIAQVEILKDASSAAIYGTRAANGVILITTKKGKLGQPTRINLNLYGGLTQVNNKLDLLNAEDLVMLKKERYLNDGIAENPFWNDAYYTTTRTDWQDALFQTGYLKNADLSISSGSENSTYLTSLGYYDESGIIESSKFSRLSARFNSSHNVLDRLKLVQNLQYSYRNWYNPSTRSVYSGVLWQALRYNPAIPVMDEAGNWGTASANNELGDINNPVYELATEDRRSNSHNILASVSLAYELASGLSLKGNLGYDGNMRNTRSFYPSVTEQMRRRNDAELSITDERKQTLLGELYADYSTQLGGHRFDAVLGVSQQRRVGEFQAVSQRGFADETLGQIVFDNGATMNSITGNFRVPEKLASIFGRLNYSFDNRYLATLTMRSDGSSKFAKGNRWGYFPGFSLGWRLSNENFLAGADFLDDLKIIGGWGMLGNQEVSDLQYLTIIQRNIDYGNKYTFGQNKVGGARITSLANPRITWEKTAMTNIGVDASFWNGALTGSLTWFDKQTTDMLIPAVVMGSIGRATIPDSNIGEMRNWGIEAEAAYQGKTSGDFRYHIGLNLTLLSNEVTQLYGNNNYIGSAFYGRQSQEISRTYQGMPLASFYGWKTDGLYQNQQEIDADANLANDPRRTDIQPGDVRFKDMNGDGMIDESDRTYLGDPNPSTILGLQFSGQYKNFSLAANIVGHFGSELFNADRMQGLDPSYSYNMYAESLNRWNGEGTSQSVPRMSTQRANLNHRTSDLFIESGDFVKLKTLTLAYEFKPKNDASGTRLTVYLMGENLLTLTGYSGYNPEIGYSDGNLQRGVDYANFPFSRKINLGFKLDF